MFPFNSKGNFVSSMQHLSFFEYKNGFFLNTYL